MLNGVGSVSDQLGLSFVTLCSRSSVVSVDVRCMHEMCEIQSRHTSRKFSELRREKDTMFGGRKQIQFETRLDE